MDDKIKQTAETQPGIQISVPGNLPILYTDSVLITKNQFGIVLDFAQSMSSTNQQYVVSRLGMSKEHGKALLKVLAERLEIDLIIEDTKKS